VKITLTPRFSAELMVPLLKPFKRFPVIAAQKRRAKAAVLM